MRGYRYAQAQVLPNVTLQRIAKAGVMSDLAHGVVRGTSSGLYAYSASFVSTTTLRSSFRERAPSTPGAASAEFESRPGRDQRPGGGPLTSPQGIPAF